MIHGYHMVLSTYGFWLPNDLRGSMSRKVYSKDLSKAGRATRSVERLPIERQPFDTWRHAAVEKLQYPPVSLNGLQAFESAMAIGAFARDSRLAIWAFSILEEHVHMVLARHRHAMEVVANLLKGAASRWLAEKEIHPMQGFRKQDGSLPKMWSEGQWIGYLDSELAIENAICYVEQNPLREGKKRQYWSFVERFRGIPKAHGLRTTNDVA